MFPKRKIDIKLLVRRTPIVDKAIELIVRRIEERSDAKVTIEENIKSDIVLEIRPNIGHEGFEIEEDSQGKIWIIGNDENGLLYGIGKFLRTSQYSEQGFELSDWRGKSVPEREIRGTYFATHFHNFYQEAPICEVTRYIEELSLWGINHLALWFDMHHFDGFEDLDAKRMLNRLREFFLASKRVGMKVGLGVLANEGFRNSLLELRIPKSWGAYGCEICPSKPGALKFLITNFEELFSKFRNIKIDFVWFWPYDQGGCSCDKCWPWGTNGFLVASKAIAQSLRRRNPQLRTILSTWYFDHYIKRQRELESVPREFPESITDWNELRSYKPKDGEWDGLIEAFKCRPQWLDYILVGHNVRSPVYPRKDGVVPGDLPLLNFPEISMRGMNPWGGFGANPQPRYLPKMRHYEEIKLSGGFTYSEGIYEDLNKVIMTQYYWEEKRDSYETVYEYACYEYSPEIADVIMKVTKIFENNMKRQKTDTETIRFVMDSTKETDRALEMLKEAEKNLSFPSKSSWRWRILYLRALIDQELAKNDFIPTEKCEEAFEELTELYYAQKAEKCVKPPVKEG